jgi:hypothetical protein
MQFHPNPITPVGKRAQRGDDHLWSGYIRKLGTHAPVYALWLALPGIFVIGGASGRRCKRSAVGSFVRSAYP